MNNDLIASKLDILIKLTAASIIKEDRTQTESILKLNSMGINYKDIAKILTTSDNYVAMILSKKRKEKRKEREVMSRGEENDEQKS